ncbi:MAG TPA: RDD family protein [Elusimicrobiota bacterium]|jgi:class 3 adenylate cyclase/uncharacterized RDD family membrane protein YckC|nr:RDD family protein [Elusimicrobiota bacterium]
MGDTRNYTILLTDIKGFTDKTSRKSRADIVAMLEAHKQLVLPTLEGKGGRLIKTIGDAFLMVYDSPTDAVLSGIAVQEALRAYNKDKAADDRIEVRVAINCGEVTLAENDVFGEPVNITARIEGVAEAGEVYFTEAVYLSMNKTEVPTSEVGLMQLKGIPEKIRVYKVRREQPVEGLPQAAASPGLWSLLKRGAPASAASAAGVAAGPRPALARRALALAIDGLICSLIVSALFGKEQVHVRYDARRAKSAAAAARPEEKAAALSIGESGIKVRDKDVLVSIGEDGVTVKEGARKGGDRGEDEEETPLYENGGFSAARRSTQRHWGFALVWLVYSLVFLKRMGATPGKRICKLAVVSAGGAPADRKQMLWRAAFSLVSGYAMFLGFLWAVFEKDRRGWHDLVAGTVVVNADVA